MRGFLEEYMPTRGLEPRSAVKTLQNGRHVGQLFRALLAQDRNRFEGAAVDPLLDGTDVGTQQWNMAGCEILQRRADPPVGHMDYIHAEGVQELHATGLPR